MNILKGRRADNLEEATLLVLHDAGKSGLSPGVTIVFTSVIDTDKLSSQAERSISTAVHGRYGRGARWYGSQWFIPLPQPQYEAQPIPQMTFAVQVYLVSSVEVETRDSAYRVTLVGPIGKAEKLILPISFLQAILEDEPAQFEIVGKDGEHTRWSIPGLREPIRLPNAFITALSAALRLKSVGSWLLDFGLSGEAVFPQVIGSLLGLQSHGMTEALPVGKQPLQPEVVIDTLTHMFGSARAAEMYQRGAPHLKSTMTNEGAISFILKEERGRF